MIFNAACSSWTHLTQCLRKTGNTGKQCCRLASWRQTDSMLTAAAGKAAQQGGSGKLASSWPFSQAHGQDGVLRVRACTPLIIMCGCW